MVSHNFYPQALFLMKRVRPSRKQLPKSNGLSFEKSTDHPGKSHLASRK